MTQLEREQLPVEIHPYKVPEASQGWRGLSLPPHYRRRKVFTLIENDQVLVTAVLQIPGGKPVHHSHESGELSIRYAGPMTPIVTWNPPGAVHPPFPSSGGPSGPRTTQDIRDAGLASAGNQAVQALLQGMLGDQHQLQQILEALAKADPAPGVIIDILFPPFKTTIVDPDLPSIEKTITGQWCD